MKHRCVIFAGPHHPLLEATKGLLDVKFDSVVMISTFESLLEAATRIRPELIVADISLPSSDGQKLLLKLDERLKGFKIIVLGSYNEAGIVNSIFEKVLNGEKFVSPLVET